MKREGRDPSRGVERTRQEKMESATLDSTCKKFCNQEQQRNEVKTRRRNEVNSELTLFVCSICLISFIRQMKTTSKFALDFS